MTIEEIKEWRNTVETHGIGIAGEFVVEIIDTLLAEARAENERLTLENRQMLQGMKWDNQLIAEARQDAAREILNDRLIIAYIAPDGIVHKQLLKKYGLEG